MPFLIMHFAVALGLTLLLTPRVRSMAMRRGVLDVPGARKAHAEPTPLLGGVAIYGAVLIALVANASRLGNGFGWVVPLGITLMFVVGVLDDCRHLHWSWKLGAQLLVALAFYRFGIKVQLGWLPQWLNLLLTIVWLVGIANAVNFLDNMNGLAAGMSAVATGFVVLLSVLSVDPRLAALAAALAGACLGFLRFNNRRRATIFMGDAGSLLIGMLLGVLALEMRFPDRRNIITWMVPVVIMMVPVFDMTLVCFSRLRNKRNPLATPGHDHVSHRLVRLGLSPARAVSVIYWGGAVCGLLAVVIKYAEAGPAYLMGLLLLAFFVALIAHLETRVPAIYPKRDKTTRQDERKSAIVAQHPTRKKQLKPLRAK